MTKEGEQEKSTPCSSFVAHKFKPGICQNCFNFENEHVISPKGNEKPANVSDEAFMSPRRKRRQKLEARQTTKKFERKRELAYQTLERNKDNKKKPKIKRSKQNKTAGTLKANQIQSTNKTENTQHSTVEEKIDQTVANWLGVDINSEKPHNEKKKHSNLLTRAIGKTTDPGGRRNKNLDHLKTTAAPKSSSLPKVLQYPTQMKNSPRRETEGTRFKEEILSYLKISILDYEINDITNEKILENDGIGLRFNLENKSVAPLVLPAQNKNYPPSQWIIPCSRDIVMKKPQLEIIVQDLLANIVIGNIIISLASIPYVHPCMTYGIVKSLSWNPYWNISGKLKIAFKFIKSKRFFSLAGSWNENSSGGDLTCISWPNSPQYFFKILAPCYCAITLFSSLGELNEIGFYLFLIESREYKSISEISRLDNSKLALIQRNCKIFKKQIRVELELKLDIGHYILLPCTKLPRIFGSYQITIATTVGGNEIKFFELENDFSSLNDKKINSTVKNSNSKDKNNPDDDFDDCFDLQSPIVKEDDRDFDDIDWDGEIDLPNNKSNSNDDDDDPFGDGFDDDFDLTSTPSKKTKKNEKKREDDDDDDPFGDGFDDDFNLSVNNNNNNNDDDDDPFDDGFDDGFDLSLASKTSVSTSNENNPKKNDKNNDDDPFDDGFGDDFDLSAKTNKTSTTTTKNTNKKTRTR